MEHAETKMEVSALRLFVEERPEGFRVWCAGDMESAHCKRIQNTLNSLRHHGRPVIVDVGGVITADLLAVTTLAQEIRALRAAGLPVVLAALDNDLRELFELTGCEDVLGGSLFSTY